VIVRLLGGGGQYRIDDDLQAKLNELDEQAGTAAEEGDEQRLRHALEAMTELVRDHGERVPDDELTASDAIVPPTDVSLAEARELLTGEGLIPDLPAPS
jgi:PspA-Associated protein